MSNELQIVRGTVKNVVVNNIGDNGRETISFLEGPICTDQIVSFEENRARDLARNYVEIDGIFYPKAGVIYEKG